MIEEYIPLNLEHGVCYQILRKRYAATDDVLSIRGVLWEQPDGDATIGRSLAMVDFDGDGIDELVATSPNASTAIPAGDCGVDSSVGHVTPLEVPLGPVSSASVAVPSVRVEGAGGPVYFGGIGDRTC